MARFEQDNHRSAEHQPNHSEHFEHGRPRALEGMHGRHGMHGMREMMHQEQRMFAQMEQQMVQNGILPQCSFGDDANQPCDDQPSPPQPQKSFCSDLGDILKGGLKAAVGLLL
jgi:hypothetical protein